jgi:Domain of unknown function (DUF4249)
MKNSIIKFLSLVFIVFVFASCEDVIKIDIPKGKPLFVVDAFLNDFNSKQTIKLSNSTPFFEVKNAAPINNASVTVTNIIKNKVYNFVFKSDGTYELDNPILGSDTFIVENHIYKLKIELNGDVFESETKVNRNTYINALNFEKRDKQGDTRAGYWMEVIGFDPPGAVTDYYWFRTKRNGDSYLVNNINVSANAGGGDGNTTDGIPFIPPVSIFGNLPVNDTYQDGDSVRVEVWSISKSANDFWEGVGTERNNGGLFASVPENVVTNIKKTKSGTEYTPVGCFSMSQVDVLGTKVPRPAIK